MAFIGGIGLVCDICSVVSAELDMAFVGWCRHGFGP